MAAKCGLRSSRLNGASIGIGICALIKLPIVGNSSVAAVVPRRLCAFDGAVSISTSAVKYEVMCNSPLVRLEAS